MPEDTSELFILSAFAYVQINKALWTRSDRPSICPRFCSLQPSNLFEPNLFSRLREPRSCKLVQKYLSSPGYKHHCFYCTSAQAFRFYLRHPIFCPIRSSFLAGSYAKRMMHTSPYMPRLTIHRQLPSM